MLYRVISIGIPEKLWKSLPATLESIKVVTFLEKHHAKTHVFQRFLKQVGLPPLLSFEFDPFLMNSPADVSAFRHDCLQLMNTEVIGEGFRQTGVVIISQFTKNVPRQILTKAALPLDWSAYDVLSTAETTRRTPPFTDGFQVTHQNMRIWFEEGNLKLTGGGGHNRRPSSIQYLGRHLCIQCPSGGTVKEFYQVTGSFLEALGRNRLGVAAVETVQ